MDKGFCHYSLGEFTLERWRHWIQYTSSTAAEGIFTASYTDEDISDNTWFMALNTIVSVMTQLTTDRSILTGPLLLTHTPAGTLTDVRSAVNGRVTQHQMLTTLGGHSVTSGLGDCACLPFSLVHAIGIDILTGLMGRRAVIGQRGMRQVLEFHTLQQMWIGTLTWTGHTY